MDKPIVFKATRRYRIQYIVIVLGGLVLATYYGFTIFLQERSVLAKVISFLLLLGVGFWGFRIGWISPKKLKICLHDDHLLGSNGTGDFQTPYSKILHVENIGDALQIDTADGNFLVEKRYYPLASIQKELENRIHPDVFIQEGWLNLSAYQELLEHQEARFAKISQELPLSMQRKMTIYFRIVVILCMLFLVVLANFSWANSVPLGALFFFGIAAFLFYDLIRMPIATVNTSGIALETRFSKYFIAWDEMTKVEHNNSFALVFYGQNKRLALPAPSYWTGEHKEDIYFYIQQTIKKRNINVVVSENAPFRFNKNTKVTN